MFRWTFIVGTVAHNILGIDFIKHFGFALDFSFDALFNDNNQLVSKITKNAVRGVELPKPFSVTD